MAFRFGLSSPSVRNAVPAFTTIRRYDEGRSCMEIVGGEAWEWGKIGSSPLLSMLSGCVHVSRNSFLRQGAYARTAYHYAVIP